MAKTGIPAEKIGRSFGIKLSTMSRILNGKGYYSSMPGPIKGKDYE